MFEYQPKRHPLQTFQFWFAILLCTGSVIAWRTGLLRVERSANPERHFVEEEMPPPPTDEIAPESVPLVSDVVTLAPPQGPEPPLAHHAEQASATFESSQHASLPMTPRKHDVTTRTPGESVIQPLAGEQPTTQPVEVDARSASHDVWEAAPELGDTLDLTEIDRLIERGDDVAALKLLSTHYWQQPEQRDRLRDRLHKLSRRVYFLPHPHYTAPYEVQFGDRLEIIAKQYDVPWQYLAKVNRVTPEKIRAGQKLKVNRGPFSVVVDLSHFELTVHAHGYFVARMPVGIGKDESTPIGTFRVTDKVTDPIYYGPDGVIQNDDPTNPLGEYWIAISDEQDTLQGYGIHGTIDPTTIGKAESKGCVRLHDQDIADLYDLLTIGSEVVIRR